MRNKLKPWGAKDIEKSIEVGDYDSSFMGLLNRVINPINERPPCSNTMSFTIEEEGPDS